MMIIFGPKWDEPIGSWRNLHEEDFHNFHSPPNNYYDNRSEEDVMGGACRT